MNASIACLLIVYALMPGSATIPEVEPMLTMLPCAFDHQRCECPRHPIGAIHIHGHDQIEFTPFRIQYETDGHDARIVDQPYNPRPAFVIVSKAASTLCCFVMSKRGACTFLIALSAAISESLRAPA